MNVITAVQPLTMTRAEAMREYTEAASEHALAARAIRRELGRSFMQCTDDDYRQYPELFREHAKTRQRYVKAIESVRRFGGFR